MIKQLAFADIGVTPSSVRSAGSTRVIKQRAANATVALGHAEEALAAFDHGAHVFGLNKGQFSMIDLAAAVLAKIGPANVSVWTWVVAARSGATVAKLAVQLGLVEELTPAAPTAAETGDAHVVEMTERERWARLGYTLAEIQRREDRGDEELERGVNDLEDRYREATISAALAGHAKALDLVRGWLEGARRSLKKADQ